MEVYLNDTANLIQTEGEKKFVIQTTVALAVI